MLSGPEGRRRESVRACPGASGEDYLRSCFQTLLRERGGGGDDGRYEGRRRVEGGDEKNEWAVRVAVE